MNYANLISIDNRILKHKVIILTHKNNIYIGVGNIEYCDIDIDNGELRLKLNKVKMIKQKVKSSNEIQDQKETL